MSRAAPPEGFRLAVPIEVRFKDIDAMGHVNNAVYFTYFENARIAYWRALGLDRPRSGATYVVARAECDFRSPATMEDDLTCHVRVSSFGRTSFRFEYLLRDERSGRVVARGSTVQAMFDHDRGEVRPVEESLRDAIRRFEGRPI
ncbi:MAG: acyl-CoA thioesterase [Acidobacteriota bacterium]